MTLNLQQQLASRWNRLKLRQQLVISLWLCTIPISAAGSTIVLRQAYQHTKQQTLQSMVFDLATMAQVMNDWLDDSQSWLTQLSEAPSLSNLNAASSSELLKQAKTAFPNTDLSVFGSDGRLIASNAATPPATTGQAAQARRNSTWFQQALQGNAGVELLKPNNNDSSACLRQSEPIRRNNINIGILQACTPPEHVAQRSGVSALLKIKDQEDDHPWLDLDRGKKRGQGVLLLSNRGELLGNLWTNGV